MFNLPAGKKKCWLALIIIFTFLLAFLLLEAQIEKPLPEFLPYTPFLMNPTN